MVPAAQWVSCSCGRYRQMLHNLKTVALFFGVWNGKSFNILKKTLSDQLSHLINPHNLLSTYGHSNKAHGVKGINDGPYQ